MQLPKAITLDLDDTLWPIAPTIRRAEGIADDWFRREAPGVLEQYDSARRASLRAALVAAHPQQAHDLGWLRRRQFATMLETSGHDPQRAEEVYALFIAARQDVELYPEALSALTRLAAHFPIAAISNGNADLQRVGLAAYFRFGLSASEHGAAKPDPGIYHAACRRLAVAPEDVLHVGDDAHADVIGARRAGLRAVWLNRDGIAWSAGESAPDLVVRDLAELADRLLHARHDAG